MLLEKLQIFVSIVASMIVTLISIYQDVSLYTLAVRLIVVIVAFYVLGLAARMYLKKFVFFELEDETGEESLENSAETGESTEGDSTMFENFDGPQPRARRSKYD